MLASPVGVKPERDGPIPYRKEVKFVKKDGTLGSTVLDVKLALKAREHDPVISFNQKRADVLGSRNSQEEKDKVNYKSWLASFTVLNDGVAKERTVNRWRQKNWTLNKVVACFLLEGDEWGDHESTATEYRERTARSRVERSNQATARGHLKVVTNDYLPDDWDSSMSTQNSLEGCEERLRPPTIVELLARCREGIKLHKSRIVHPTTSRHVSKPLLVAANDDVHAKLLPVGKVLAVLAGKENDILEGKVRPLLKMGHAIAESKYWEVHSDGSIHTTNLIHDSGREARDSRKYASWLRNPQFMRNVMKNDRYNRHVPSEQRMDEFDKEHPTYSEEQEAGIYKYRLRLQKLRRRRRLLEKEKSPYALRLELFNGLWDEGKIVGTKASRKMKTLLRLLAWKERKKQSKPQSTNFVLVGEPYGEPSREEKAEQWLLTSTPFTAQIIGLDTMPPMTTLEYEDISRLDSNSIDEHLWAEKRASRQQLYHEEVRSSPNSSRKHSLFNRFH